MEEVDARPFPDELPSSSSNSSISSMGSTGSSGSDEDILDVRLVKRLFRKSAKRIVPQLGRVSRALETAAKSEIKIYLRENGIDTRIMTDEEFDFLVAAIERKPPADEPEKIARFAKTYCHRQLRLAHNPGETARYLRYSFRDTLKYFCIFATYMVLIYASCNRLNWIACILTRLAMTLHLGYYNLLWAKKISQGVAIQTRDAMVLTWKVMKYVPAFLFETLHVLFEVFVGWPLLASMWGIFFVIYLVPIAFPQMGLSSAPLELYMLYINDDDIPTFLKFITLFI